MNIPLKRFLPIMIMNLMQKKEMQPLKLLRKNMRFFSHAYKDQVMFEKDEVVKDDGKPLYCFYALFTKMEIGAE